MQAFRLFQIIHPHQTSNPHVLSFMKERAKEEEGRRNGFDEHQDKANMKAREAQNHNNYGKT